MVVARLVNQAWFAATNPWPRGARDTETRQRMTADFQPDSDARYSFAEAFPLIVWVALPDGRHVYFNRRWYEYTGMSREDSLGDGWSAPLHADDRDRSVKVWRDAADKGEPYEIEYRFRNADGAYRWFLGRALPQCDDQGAVVRWIGTCTDIDDQKRAQEQLGQSERRFRGLAETIPQMVWTTTPQGDVTYFNQRWFEYTGRTTEQSLNWEWVDAIHPQDQEPSVRTWKEALETHHPVEFEYRIRRGADGAYRWHLVRGLPILDDHGAVIQWFGASTDIDDQKRQAELLERLVWEQTSELRRSNFDLEQFASVASHDLQEPLRKIQAFSDRLQIKCGPALGEQGKEYLTRIVSAVGRMRTLINDLLAFSRVTLKGQPFAKVDLQALAHEVVSDLEILIHQSGGRVELGPMPAIQADPLQMRQLFQNLIGNALKFHRPDAPPVVRVTAYEVFGEDKTKPIAHELRFADDGIGFEEIYADRIFQVFQRLHGRNEYDGTGMGLAICRKIVERHSGRITATSEPGKGSMFSVTLPVHPSNQEFSLHDTRAQADHNPDGR
jgi:PAS domain S-box-containing protein